MPHVCCMSGHTQHTAEKAKCYRDGSLHREESSPQKCSGCVNQMAPDSYLKNIEAQMSEAERAAADADRPLAVRQANGRRATNLRRVLEAERQACLRNKNLFLDAQTAWEATVARNIMRTHGGPAADAETHE